MHQENKERHKTRKTKDQTRKIIKNNLKIKEEHMMNFQKLKIKSMQLTPNLKFDTRLTQETQNFWFLWFY